MVIGMLSVVTVMVMTKVTHAMTMEMVTVTVMSCP